MARSVNKVFLVGNVGADPDIRESSNGNKIARVSLATNRRVPKGDGQYEDRTDWHRLVFFGKQAETVEKIVEKGAKIHVEGRIEYDQWQDSEGNQRYGTSIVSREFVLLSGPGGGRGGSGGLGGDGNGPANPPSEPAAGDDQDSTLPF